MADLEDLLGMLQRSVKDSLRQWSEKAKVRSWQLGSNYLELVIFANSMPEGATCIADVQYCLASACHTLQ